MWPGTARPDHLSLESGLVAAGYLEIALSPHTSAQSGFRPDELEEFKEAFALFDDSGSGTIEVTAHIFS